MKGKREEPHGLKTLDIVLIALGTFLLLFIVTMIVIFCVKGSVPDVLIERVLSFGEWEAGATALITISKLVTKVFKKNEEE